MDIEQKQSHVNWESLATSSAAYSLKNTYDTEILTYMVAQATTVTYGTTGTPITIGYGAGNVTPLNAMNRLNRLLNEQNVPQEQRWFAAPPVFWESIYAESSKLIGTDFESTMGTNSGLTNGLMMERSLRGFNCYTTNNITGYSATVFYALCGHMSSTTTANSIIETETFRDPDSFADIVRGLNVYGRKVLRTEALGLLTFSMA